MYVNVKLGRGFAGLVKYQFKEEREKPSRIISTNLGTDDEREIIRSFVDVSQEKPRVAKPVMHMIVSWHQDDEVSDETMAAVGRRLLDRLGLDEDNHQCLMVRHEDTDNAHMHIIANRVGFDGTVMEPEFCGKKARDEGTKLDLEYGFRTSQRAVTNAAKRGENVPAGMKMSPPSRDGNDPIPLTKMQEREGMRAAKHQVFTRVKEALMHCDGTLEDLDEEVRKRGVMADWSFNKNGEFNGASFTLMNNDGTEPIRHGGGEDAFAGRTYTFKGSQLGPKPGLSCNYINKVLEARQEAIARKELRSEVREQDKTRRKAERETKRQAFAAQARSQKLNRIIVGSGAGNLRRTFKAYSSPLNHSAVFSILGLLSAKSVPTFKLRPPVPGFNARRR